MSIELQEETFFHELVHCVLRSGGYYDECDNEKLVDCLGNGLYQAMRDNGLLTQPLWEAK